MNISLKSLKLSRFPRRRGFTLIEILVVIGMLAILSTVVLIAVNPLRQFAQARNTERENDVAAVLNAVSERIADNGGTFAVPGDTSGCSGTIPSTSTDVGDGTSQFDLRPCVVSTYISELPKDPASGVNTCTSTNCDGTGESYDLNYFIQQDPATRRITICAPNAAETALPGSTSFCLTR
jgi:prepilin-type N-terminal cleavage/methylation domain-containing protein